MQSPDHDAEGAPADVETSGPRAHEHRVLSNGFVTAGPGGARGAFRGPGRPADGGPLVRGMKIAVTGGTVLTREELVARALAAGLDMTNSVGRYTGALIANDPAAPSAKARRARAEGVPIISERAFLRLLGDVRPGGPPGHSTRDSR
ncbi:hypothetical protein ACFY4C_06185 [Actinomadura viridis]|uniref:hypothetical protein n=1 Tax=Actinomadura viridis TaxID=58110 RepID=UPI0036A1F896